MAPPMPPEAPVTSAFLPVMVNTVLVLCGKPIERGRRANSDRPVAYFPYFIAISADHGKSVPL
jgi:hypothetical protein